MKNIREFEDIHHHLSAGEDCNDQSRVVSIDYDEDVPPQGYYSIGIHPWSTTGLEPEELDRAMKLVESKVDENRTVAIGECGIDRLKGAPVEFQETVLRRHIALSERLQLPLILHAVRANDIILRLKKEIRPRQLWIIHGFRGKTSVAEQYINNGIAISVNKAVAVDLPQSLPAHMIFSESD